MSKPTIAFRKLEALTPDPRNARTHSSDQIAEIAASIRRFGWTNPVLADDLIRAGHGRVAAARSIYDAGERIHMAPGAERGGHEVPAGQVPVIDCTGWSEGERRAYALADNRIAENAGWDYTLLHTELEALGTTEFDLASIGFDPDALASIAEQATADQGTARATPDAPGEFPEFDEDIETEHQCPKCSYRWSGKSS